LLETGGVNLKYVLIFIGLIILTFITFSVLGAVLDAQSGDEALLGVSVLAIQNAAIITLLIYLISKQNKK